MAVSLYVDAEEVLEGPHVLHGELGLEEGDDVLEKDLGGGAKHHVVD